VGIRAGNEQDKAGKQMYEIRKLADIQIYQCADVRIKLQNVVFYPQIRTSAIRT
jgi:hypothetical protein